MENQLSEKLIKEWNYERNGDLKPEDFTYGCRDEVWWKCEKCGREWPKEINRRDNGKKGNCKCLKFNNVAVKSEEEQREFIVAFRELSKLLLILKTFVEFNFDEDSRSMDEQEYEDYKSKYHLLYENSKNNVIKTSILHDIDFEIELMESDKINVAYIIH